MQQELLFGENDVRRVEQNLFWFCDCIQASRDELHIRKMKLNYQEVGQCFKDAQALWEKKLSAPGRTTNPQDKEEIYGALCQGKRCACVCVGMD